MTPAYNIFQIELEMHYDHLEEPLKHAVMTLHTVLDRTMTKSTQLFLKRSMTKALGIEILTTKDMVDYFMKIYDEKEFVVEVVALGMATANKIEAQQDSNKV